MYLIRRTIKTKPGKAWQTAGFLKAVCEAYEKNGRNKATVYIGQGCPGEQDVAYAEWTQETIEPNWFSNIPEAVGTNAAKMREITEGPHTIEFFEIATAEKLTERGLV